MSGLWQASCGERLTPQRPEGALRLDLAIIGGGFTGTSAALSAASAGAKVALFEAQTIGHGGSGRNVGLVNAGLWLPPDEILAQMGEDAGTRLITVLGAAPDEVFARIGQHDIACEPVRAGTLHCAHSDAGLQDLRNRFGQGNRLGAPIRLLDAEATRRRVGSGRFHGALFDPRAGTVQPLAYCRGLARAAQQAGAIVVENTPVTDLRRDGADWVVAVDGQSHRARAVLIATNAYHLGLEAFRPAHIPVSYSQFATVPIDPDRRKGVLEGGEGCWDTALVMSSFRFDQAGRLIVGGMGDRDGRHGAVHDGWARRKLRHLFPQLGDVPFAYAWQGRIAMTSDHVPKIVAFGPSALACFGYSGRGIAPGTVFGAAAARALLSGDRDGLPVKPVAAHAERFAGVRATYYETGATLTHALSPRGRG